MGSGGNFLELQKLAKPFEQLGQGIGKALGFEPVYDINESVFNPTGQETAFTNALIARSQGNAPSVAEQQMQAGLQTGQAQAMGTAAAQRGINPALAARLAQMQQGAMANQTNQQAGILRAQEQMANDQLLQQAFTGQRQGRVAGEQAKYNAANAQADRFSNLLKGVASAGATAASGGASGGASGVVTAAEGALIMPQQAQGPGSMMLGQFLAQNENPSWKESALTSYLSNKKGGVKDMAGTPLDNNFANKGMLTVVPGEPKVAGDHKMNDQVPAMLSPGEIVVPRSVASMSEMDIAKFVKALKAGV